MFKWASSFFITLKNIVIAPFTLSAYVQRANSQPQRDKYNCQHGNTRIVKGGIDHWGYKAIFCDDCKTVVEFLIAKEI